LWSQRDTSLSPRVASRIMQPAEPTAASASHPIHRPAPSDSGNGRTAIGRGMAQILPRSAPSRCRRRVPRLYAHSVPPANRPPATAPARTAARHRVNDPPAATAARAAAARGQVAHLPERTRVDQQAQQPTPQRRRPQALQGSCRFVKAQYVRRKTVHQPHTCCNSPSRIAAAATLL
jgi:hypothetical protein